MELLRLVSRRWLFRWSSGCPTAGQARGVAVLQAGKPEEGQSQPTPPGRSLRSRWLRRCSRSGSSSSWKPSLGSISEDGSFPCDDATGSVSRRGRSTAAGARASINYATATTTTAKKKSPKGTGTSSSSPRADSYRRDFSAASAFSIVPSALVPAPFLF